MKPHAPKTQTDEKMERHFNGIIMTVLGIIATVLLIAIVVFYKKGPVVTPSANRPSSTSAQPRSNVE